MNALVASFPVVGAGVPGGRRWRWCWARRWAWSASGGSGPPGCALSLEPSVSSVSWNNCEPAVLAAAEE
jgi:hypothetical protein